MSYLPAKPTGDHLRTLLDQGASHRAIAHAAGVSETGIVNIASGRQRFVESWTATHVAALTLLGVIPYETTGFPATGTLRRIQALLAIGWTHALLTSFTGVDTAGVLHDSPRRVSSRTYRAVEAAYREHALTPGPSAANRTRARKNGWEPPLAWEEDAIDDPNASPWVQPPALQEKKGAAHADQQAGIDEVAVERAMSGEPPAGMTRTERTEAVRRLALSGRSNSQIADRLGVHVRSVERMRADSDIACGQSLPRSAA